MQQHIGHLLVCGEQGFELPMRRMLTFKSLADMDPKLAARVRSSTLVFNGEKMEQTKMDGVIRKNPATPRAEKDGRAKAGHSQSVDKKITGTKEEELLAQQLTSLGISFIREFRFHPTRRWRLDFLLEGVKVAIEIDGGRWAPGGGRHGGDADKEKMAEAAIAGYRVIRASPAQVRNGTAARWAQEALGK